EDRCPAGAADCPGREELQPHVVRVGVDDTEGAERARTAGNDERHAERRRRSHPSAPVSFSRAMSSQPYPASSSTSSVCWPSSGAGPCPSAGVPTKRTGLLPWRRRRPTGGGGG